ncbi:uncharacterized protein LOC110449146 isoform X2 [Mizuhopecten yessoensis]|uniref:uncharacterized protein LOC110449146 isoform X2 n=1 Tax=Mizuhopecten yessoensis TaxID=6573 RepID=UPI000B45ACE3|nr:uncharacterized protein LOC110449146 isoform X2 [Mizuhopecten yessoensis]
MSYANQYVNTHNSSPLEMSPMYVNEAATTNLYTYISDASLVQREETVNHVNGVATPNLYTTISDASLVQRHETVNYVNGAATTDPNTTISDASLGQREETFKRTPYRRLCCFAVIILLMVGVIALAIIGIIHLSEPSKHQDQPISESLQFCVGSITASASASAQSNCSRLATSVAVDIFKVRVSFPGNKTIVNSSMRLSDSINITVAGLWIVSWSKVTEQLTVSPRLGALTCKMEGTYLFEYLNSSNSLVYYQIFSLTYLGNLDDVRVSAQPYLAGNGISKLIHLSCSMKTGCHHGVFVPEMKKGEDTLFIHDVSCTYTFNTFEEGVVTCTTDIDADVWVSKDEVICSLKLDDGVHQLVPVGRIDTSNVNLANHCTLVSFTIGEPGYINCKKRIHGDVNIFLERKGYYFGDWITLLTISGEGSGKALNDRLTFTAMKNADMMEINITMSEVHCGDKGHLALNYSDGSRTNIEVNAISAVPPRCHGSETRSLHADNNFILFCAWCPGHDVEEVLVNHTKTENGVGTMLPSFPITFFVDSKTEHKEQNLTIKFTQQYGVMRVDITRLKGVGCNYGGYYSITLRSPQGSSNRNIHVNITIPQSLYTFSITDTPVIAGRDLYVEFKGFMGCSVSNVIAKQDGVSLLASAVTVADEDIRDALAFKIVWSYKPVELALHTTFINASMSFPPLGEQNRRSYTTSKRFDVLEDSFCDNFASCNVAHPSVFGLYIACNAASLIQAVNKCPAGLSLIYPDPNNCLGQCG